MIHSFACAETEKIWNGKSSRKLPQQIQERALRKLRQLDVSLSIQDLRHPATISKYCRGIGQGSIAYGLINNGDFALYGMEMKHGMLRLLTIIKGKYHD
jgi:hypothetical protein